MMLAAVASLFAMSASGQNTISINFDNGDNTITGSTGAVNAGSWNELTFGAAGVPNTLTDLTLDDGNPSTADIDLQNKSAGSAGGFDFALSGATGEAENLFTERNRNGGAIASLSQVPFSLYDVYVYAGLIDITLKLNDGSTITEVAIDANGDGSSFVEATGGLTHNNEGAGNYYVFSGVTASSFTLTTGDAIDGGAGSNNGFVYGMQLVAVPEPSAFALIAGAFGLSWMMLRRRRS